MRIRPLVLLVCSLLALSLARPAGADEIAPELLAAELRQKAASELKRLVKGLPDADRRRLVGVYLAFDPTVVDASAMAACDDDGDYVVVLTDGMLRLVDDVAHVAALDEANGTHKVEDYAVHLARTQLPGKRLVPPPAGSYSADAPAAAHDERLREALAFVIARELAHQRAGDLVCPRPTATHEHGDDEWTEAEQRAAGVAAKALYASSERAAERDAEAARRIEGTTGAEALLSFFARLEAETPRAPTTYLKLHPRASERLKTVKASRK